MAYLKPPPLITKVANPLLTRFGSGRIDTLTVVGRTSGRAIKIPVVALHYDGVRYLVSARGETEWVRNLRKAGRCSLESKGSTTQYLAEEIPIGDRDAILAAYQIKVGTMVASLFRKLPDPKDHPVFKLAVTGSPTNHDD